MVNNCKKFRRCSGYGSRAICRGFSGGATEPARICTYYEKGIQVFRKKWLTGNFFPKRTALFKMDRNGGHLWERRHLACPWVRRLPACLAQARCLRSQGLRSSLDFFPHSLVNVYFFRILGRLEVLVRGVPVKRAERRTILIYLRNLCRGNC